MPRPGHDYGVRPKVSACILRRRLNWLHCISDCPLHFVHGMGPMGVPPPLEELLLGIPAHEDAVHEGGRELSLDPSEADEE